MGNVIFLVGDTGTGKSHSLQYLNSDSTAIVNVLGKQLPWRGSKKDYNAEKKNIVKRIKNADVIMALKAKGEDPKVKVIVLDDVGYIMIEDFFAKASVTGYEKFTVMAKNLQDLIKAAKDVVPADKTVIFCFHDDIADKEQTKKIKLIGKMVDDKYNPLGVVSICIFTRVTFDGKGNPEFNFIVRRSITEEGITIPAKAPDGMFTQAVIPNNMGYVIDCMNAYYDGDEPPVLLSDKKKSSEDENNSENNDENE